MATMNKPVLGDTNWYQPVTDNWTSIEEDLIDKSIIAAKGDVIAATGASAPTSVAVGTDGQGLVADSAQAAGVAWATPAPTSLPDKSHMSQVVLDRRFFDKAGLLPGTRYYETPADQAPTVDWDNTGVTPVSSGVNKRWEGVAGSQLLGWDLGAPKQRILVICSCLQSSSTGPFIFASTGKPSSGDLTTGHYGYAGGLAGYVGPSGFAFKITHGTYNKDIPQTSYFGNTPWTTLPYAMAFRFDNGNIRVFFRWGAFQWIEGIWMDDGLYPSLRYVGIRFYLGGILSLGPMSIWYDD